MQKTVKKLLLAKFTQKSQKEKLQTQKSSKKRAIEQKNTSKNHGAAENS